MEDCMPDNLVPAGKYYCIHCKQYTTIVEQTLKEYSDIWDDKETLAVLMHGAVPMNRESGPGLQTMCGTVGFNSSVQFSLTIASSLKNQIENSHSSS